MKNAIIGFLGVLGLAVLLTLPLHAQSSPGEDSFITSTAAINTETTVISVPAGSRIRVKAVFIRSDTAGQVLFRDGVAGPTFLPLYCAQNANVEPQVLFGKGKLTNSNVLTVQLASATISGTIRYSVE